MEEYPWLLIYPAALLSLTLFSLNFLGDGLPRCSGGQVIKVYPQMNLLRMYNKSPCMAEYFHVRGRIREKYGSC